MVSLNDLKFGTHANITNIKVQFVDEVDPMNRFITAVVINTAQRMYTV